MDKLVRDRVPDELRRLGRTITVTSIAGDEYVRRLKEKLIEEATEAATAQPPAIIDELADVIEVVHALAQAANSSIEELLAAVRRKQERLGGFSAGVLLLDNGLPDHAS